MRFAYANLPFEQPKKRGYLPVNVNMSSFSAQSALLTPARFEHRCGKKFLEIRRIFGPPERGERP